MKARNPARRAAMGASDGAFRRMPFGFGVSARGKLGFTLWRPFFQSPRSPKATGRRRRFPPSPLSDCAFHPSEQDRGFAYSAFWPGTHIKGPFFKTRPRCREAAPSSYALMPGFLSGADPQHGFRYLPFPVVFFRHDPRFYGRWLSSLPGGILRFRLSVRSLREYYSKKLLPRMRRS